MTAQVVTEPYRHRGAWRLTWRSRSGKLRFARVGMGARNRETGRELTIQRFDGNLAKLGPETVTTAKLGPGGTLPAAILRTAYREPRR